MVYFYFSVFFNMNSSIYLIFSIMLVSLFMMFMFNKNSGNQWIYLMVCLIYSGGMMIMFSFSLCMLKVVKILTVSWFKWFIFFIVFFFFLKKDFLKDLLYLSYGEFNYSMLLMIGLMVFLMIFITMNSKNIKCLKSLD